MLATVLIAVAGTTGARAHGDPTTHYLETDNLSTSYASPPAVPVELRLRGLLDAAAKRGYPIKVALLANEGDTDGDPEPLEQPQEFAESVSADLALVVRVRAPVLIVTPKSIAVGGYHLRGGVLRPVGRADARALVRGVAVAGPGGGNDLARAAMLAVRKVARAGGRPLPANVPPAEQNLTGIAASVSADGGGIGAGEIAILAGGVLLLGGALYAVRRRASRRRAANAPSD